MKAINHLAYILFRQNIIQNIFSNLSVHKIAVASETVICKNNEFKHIWLNKTNIQILSEFLLYNVLFILTYY